MENEGSKIKNYVIPHNYKNNGRLFNLFEKSKVTRSLIWAVPVTFAIFNLPISLFAKFLAETLAIIPPVLIFLTGFDDLIWDLVIFTKKRKFYYNVERGDSFESWYEKQKKNHKGRIQY